MKMKFFVDWHKAITLAVVLALMGIYNQRENPTAWVYLGLHGSYGLLWALKSRFFPDRIWEKPASPINGLGICLALSTYWIAPCLLMARGVQAPGWLLGMCTGLYAFGVFFHFAGDMQKSVHLALRLGELITGGLFSLSRNINYFGELLIYTAFALLALHLLPLLILTAWVGIYWLPNRRRKDRSLARYLDFEDYRQRTRLFIPFFF